MTIDSTLDHMETNEAKTPLTRFFTWAEIEPENDNDIGQIRERWIETYPRMKPFFLFPRRGIRGLEAVEATGQSLWDVLGTKYDLLTLCLVPAPLDAELIAKQSAQLTPHLFLVKGLDGVFRQVFWNAYDTWESFVHNGPCKWHKQSPETIRLTQIANGVGQEIPRSTRDGDDVYLLHWCKTNNQGDDWYSMNVIEVSVASPP